MPFTDTDAVSGRILGTGRVFLGFCSPNTVVVNCEDNLGDLKAFKNGGSIQAPASVTSTVNCADVADPMNTRTC
jgi:hypothetical protein